MDFYQTKLFFVGFFYKGYSPNIIQTGHLIILSLYISCVLTSDTYPTLYQICKFVNKEPLEKLFMDCVKNLNYFLEACKCSPPDQNLLEYILKNPTLDWIYN